MIEKIRRNLCMQKSKTFVSLVYLTLKCRNVVVLHFQFNKNHNTKIKSELLLTDEDDV